MDLDLIDRLYADDLLLTAVLGEPSCTKSALFEKVARGRAERDAVSVSQQQQLARTVKNEDMKVTTCADAAVATYRFVVTMTRPDVDVRRRFRPTNVWMRRHGRWQIVAHTRRLSLTRSRRRCSRSVAGAR